MFFHLFPPTWRVSTTWQSPGIGPDPCRICRRHYRAGGSDCANRTVQASPQDGSFVKNRPEGTRRMSTPQSKPSSEVELGADFHQPSSYHLCRVQPRIIRRAEPGVQIEDIAPVEDVIDVKIASYPRL